MILKNQGVTLSPKQADIFWNPARFKIGAGGERAGKSFVAAAWLFTQLWTTENELFWLMGDYYETCRAEFTYLVDWARKLNAIEVLRFPDDKNEQCVLILKGSLNRIETKTTSDETRIAERAPYRVVGCEVPRWTWEAFIRTRGRLAEKRGWGFFTGSFETSMGWFPELFKKWAGPNEDEGASFSLPSWSNIFIYPGGKDDPEILRLEALYPRERFMERIAGEPCPPQGVVFNEFRRTSHVSERATLEDAMRLDKEPALYLAVDPGDTTYAVEVVWVHGNRMAVIDEIYETGMTHEDVVQRVFDMKSPGGKSYVPLLRGVAIDVAGRQHPAGESAIEVWEKKLKIPTMSMFIHIEDGVMSLKSYLRRNADGTPRLLVNPKCKGLIMEFGGGGMPGWMRSEGVFRYKTDGSGVVLGAKPLPVNDHAVKALWYLTCNLFGFSQDAIAPAQYVSYFGGRRK